VRCFAVRVGADVLFILARTYPEKKNGPLSLTLKTNL
jgi:hypothetical protein